MKKFFSLMAVLVLLSSAVQAKTWRINNDPAAKADFLSINDAMESLEVYPGDVLYLDPGCSLPEQTIKKSVTIIGTGYNLTESEEARVGGINIGTNDIKLTGINITGSLHFLGSLNNITVERCRIQGIEGTYGFSSLGTKIIGCYICGSIISNGNSNPFIIRNSIILGCIEKIKNGVISNNVIIYNGEKSYLLNNISNSTISNNIIINTTTKTTTSDNTVITYNHQTIQNTTVADNNNIVHNVLSTDKDHAWADFPTNKFIGAKVEDIFVNEGNQEEKYKLKANSPALGYGTNGVDCGAYDGMYPYVINGRPQFVPYIYDAQIDNTPTDGKINITLKIKSQNE